MVGQLQEECCWFPTSPTSAHGDGHSSRKAKVSKPAGPTLWLVVFRIVRGKKWISSILELGWKE